MQWKKIVQSESFFISDARDNYAHNTFRFNYNTAVLYTLLVSH